MAKRQEMFDFKMKAYRTLTEGDRKFQNWQAASTVALELVVEIDGIEIPVASQILPYSQWERAIKNYGKEPTQA